MKRLIIISLVLAMGMLQLIATKAQAASVPHFLNYQSLLYDEGGNLLPDGPANITFRIIDADGAVLFEEQQTVDVVYGAVSTLVGNGLDANGAPSGGIPVSILTPGATRYLEVAVAGYTPESYLEIVSVPYAVYAEKALGAADESIGTSALAKKSITIDHLADSFVEDLVDAMSSGGLIATASDLSSLRSAYRSTSGATTIGVSSGFVYSGGSNIQVVLQDLDRAIQLRQAGIDAVAAAINSKVSKTGDTMSGILNMGGNKITSLGAPTSTSDAVRKQDLDNEATARSSADSAEASTRSTFDSTHTHTGGTDGAKLNGLAFWVDSGSTTSGDFNTPSIPGGFDVNSCEITVGLHKMELVDGIDTLCIKYCRDTVSNSFRIRCVGSTNHLSGADPCTSYFGEAGLEGSNCNLVGGSPGNDIRHCNASYMIFCPR